MQIQTLKNSPYFGMKISPNAEFDKLAQYMSNKRGYSEQKIKGIIKSIKSLADDSYEFRINSSGSDGYICYSIIKNSPDAVMKKNGDVCSTMRFFMLRSIKNTVKNMIAANKN